MSRVQKLLGWVILIFGATAAILTSKAAFEFAIQRVVEAKVRIECLR